MLYEGKAKQVFATDCDHVVMVHYKDDATAGDGAKKGTISGKGVVNNRLSNAFMKRLNEKMIPTHYIEEINDRDTFVEKLDIIPLEVIVRNVSAGSFAKRMGVEEGIEFSEPIFELSYKNDDLHDPFINDDYAVALGIANRLELREIHDFSMQVNDYLKKWLDEVGIRLIDFKLEYGYTPDHVLTLGDEISPDTCRFWDKETGKHLDKDLFRRGLGGESEAYKEVMARLLG